MAIPKLLIMLYHWIPPPPSWLSASGRSTNLRLPLVWLGGASLFPGFESAEAPVMREGRWDGWVV